MLVIDEMVEEGPAEALHHGSNQLAVQDEGIEGATYVLDCDVVEHFNRARSDVNGNRGRMCAISIGKFRVGEAAYNIDRTSPFTRLSSKRHQVEFYGAVMADESTITPMQIIDRNADDFRCQFEQLFDEFFERLRRRRCHP